MILAYYEYMTAVIISCGSACAYTSCPNRRKAFRTHNKIAIQPIPKLTPHKNTCTHFIYTKVIIATWLLNPTNSKAKQQEREKEREEERVEEPPELTSCHALPLSSTLTRTRRFECRRICSIINLCVRRVTKKPREKKMSALMQCRSFPRENNRLCYPNNKSRKEQQRMVNPPSWARHEFYQLITIT